MSDNLTLAVWVLAIGQAVSAAAFWAQAFRMKSNHDKFISQRQEEMDFHRSNRDDDRVYRKLDLENLEIMVGLNRYEADCRRELWLEQRAMRKAAEESVAPNQVGSKSAQIHKDQGPEPIAAPGV
jgi:hypothetical protein